MTSNLKIDQTRLLAELHHLATFTELQAAPAAEGQTPVTRIVFTPQDREARAYLASLAEAANLLIRTDAIGNTFFRWQGSSPALPAIATGSHIDAIPNAGMYDGTIGVLGGLEAIRSLQAAGFSPKRSIELILFTSEEPTRFGLGCLGSRLLSGALAPAAAQTLTDKQGQTLDQLRAAAGFEGSLEEVQLSPSHYAGFVELHIEQGPLLEREGLEIGIVTAIAAPAAATITVQGESGHAGALLMPDRRDALAAAAELILAIESAALATGAIDTVATVGQCTVFPGNSNAVPARVQLSLDVRDIDVARRNSVLAAIQQACTRIAATRNASLQTRNNPGAPFIAPLSQAMSGSTPPRLTITTELLNADAPAPCSPPIVNTIAEACAVTQTSYKLMPSRAYHDSLFMARLCRIAMIFIPSRAGVSHRPDEYSTPLSIAQGTQILAQTLATLSLS